MKRGISLGYFTFYKLHKEETLKKTLKNNYFFKAWNVKFDFRLSINGKSLSAKYFFQ